MIELNPPLSASLELIRRQIAANESRDYTVYNRSMDAALYSKAAYILPHFGDVPEGAIIVDAGSGTGSLAELVAREFRGTRVIGLDISHELLERAHETQALIELVYGDASIQQFPDNSIHIIYSSTSGHEMESFGGAGTMTKAVENWYRQNRPGGRTIIRDFCKPALRQPVYMRILGTAGVDTIEEATVNGYTDYSLLSTRALFTAFYNEFQGGNAFTFKTNIINGVEYIVLDSEWAHEFYLRKDYTANWRQELKEKYTYWTLEDSRKALENVGFTNVQVIPEWNEYIVQHRLNGKICLYAKNTQSDALEPIDFPPTHMVLVGEKPVHDTTVVPVTPPAENIYDKRKESIHLDPEHSVVTIGSRVFKLDPTKPIATGTKKTVYHLADQRNVLKVPSLESFNVHGAFKAILQSVERVNVLRSYGIPHLPILEKDPEGPPYRYFIQQRIPDGSLSAVDLLKAGELTENDVRQMAQVVNTCELGRIWQVDTNPYNWYRILQADGTWSMTYTDMKVYRYDEQWVFARIGLLQWLDVRLLDNIQANSSIIPTAKDYTELEAAWPILHSDPYVRWWKKYLHPLLQPSN